MNRCLSWLARRRIFGLLAEGSALPKPHVITAAFDPKHFSVDSRNENLPNKHIHQNYVWIAVAVRPFHRRRVGTE
jgi:hypothetical protein